MPQTTGRLQKKKYEKMVNISEYKEFLSNFSYFHINYDELKRTYPDKFVAVHKKEIVDSDADAESLIKRLREKYSNLDSFVIEFVSSSKVELIL